MESLETVKRCAQKEMNILGKLLHHAYPTLQSQLEFKIPITELHNNINFKDDEFLLKALHSLSAMSVKIEYVDEISNEKKWAISPLLGSFHIENDICTYSFSELMKKIACKQDIYSVLKLIV